MTKLLIYPIFIFSVVLAGLSFMLKENYKNEISSAWVVYTSYEYNPNTYRDKISLYQLNLDTGKQDLITDQLVKWYEDVEKASWSPDGQWIYYVTADNLGKHHLYRKHVTDDTPQKIISDWGIYSNRSLLSWTPDNQWIVHFRPYQNDRALYRMKPDGSHVKRLTPDDIIYVTISPDSQWLYYYRWTISSSQLYRVKIDTSQDNELEQDNLGDFAGWSPDGQWLYFNQSRSIIRLKADGTELDNVTDNDEGNFYRLSQWSPDRTQFLYRFVKSGSYSLPRFYIFYTISDTAMSLIEISSNQFDISPDNNWTYIYNYNEGIFRVAMEENAAIDWLIQTDGFSFKRWSADMSGFYYEIHSNKYRLYYFDVQTKQSTYLTQWDENLDNLSFISPNEKYVLLFQDDLCWIKLKNNQQQCLPRQSGYEEFIDWQPPIHEKSWHPNNLLLLASGLIIGCGGVGVYLSRWNARSHYQN